MYNRLYQTERTWLRGPSFSYIACGQDAYYFPHRDLFELVHEEEFVQPLKVRIKLKGIVDARVLINKVFAYFTHFAATLTTPKYTIEWWSCVEDADNGAFLTIAFRPHDYRETKLFNEVEPPKRTRKKKTQRNLSSATSR